MKPGTKKGVIVAGGLLGVGVIFLLLRNRASSGAQQQNPNLVMVQSSNTNVNDFQNSSYLQALAAESNLSAELIKLQQLRNPTKPTVGAPTGPAKGVNPGGPIKTVTPGTTTLPTVTPITIPPGSKKVGLGGPIPGGVNPGGPMIPAKPSSSPVPALRLPGGVVIPISFKKVTTGGPTNVGGPGSQLQTATPGNSQALYTAPVGTPVSVPGIQPVNTPASTNLPSTAGSKSIQPANKPTAATPINTITVMSA